MFTALVIASEEVPEDTNNWSVVPVTAALKKPVEVSGELNLGSIVAGRISPRHIFNFRGKYCPKLDFS